VLYSVTSPNAGSTYTWGVPTGATIASGQGSATITVNFGSSGGNVTVFETTSTKCVGPQGTYPVTASSFSFSVSALPSSRTIAKPSTQTTYTITVAPTAACGGNVTLGVTGLPAFATASFSPQPVTVPAGGSGTSTMTLNINKRKTPNGTST